MGNRQTNYSAVPSEPLLPPVTPTAPNTQWLVIRINKLRIVDGVYEINDMYKSKEPVKLSGFVQVNVDENNDVVRLRPPPSKYRVRINGATFCEYGFSSFTFPYNGKYANIKFIKFTYLGAIEVGAIYDIVFEFTGVPNYLRDNSHIATVKRAKLVPDSEVDPGIRIRECVSG